MNRLLGVVMSLFAASATAADPAWVYFGGYTGSKTGGEGIMLAEFDGGKLTAPTLAVKVASPSFLTPSPDGKTLYAVGEAEAKSGDGGPVYAYRVGPTGTLTLLNSLPSGGGGPCHVALDPQGEYAVVANYGGGSMAIFKLGDDGRLVARTAFVQHEGSGPNEGRQKGPHAHCGRFDPTGNYVLVCDLGADRVFVYQLNRATGELTARKPVVLPAGSGPRHMDLTRDGKWLFVNGELDATVNVIKLDLPGDQSEVVQSLTTLPEETKGNTTAECRLHPSEKFVYVSNRGHDSIACYQWDGSRLAPIGHATESIRVPRNFNFDPTGEFLVVANQATSDAVVYKVEPTGKLTLTQTRVETPAPVCVKFIPRAGK